MSIALGPWLIARLRHAQIGQYIREDGPHSHQKKAGTPTMGGVLVVISILVPTLLLARLSNPYVWVAMFGPGGLCRHRFLGRYAQGPRAAQPRSLRAAEVPAPMSDGSPHRPYAARPARTRPLLHQYQCSVLQTISADLLIKSCLGNPWTYPLAFMFFFLFLIVVIRRCLQRRQLTDGLDGLAIGLMIIAAQWP